MKTDMKLDYIRDPKHKNYKDIKYITKENCDYIVTFYNFATFLSDKDIMKLYGFNEDSNDIYRVNWIGKVNLSTMAFAIELGYILPGNGYIPTQKEIVEYIENKLDNIYENGGSVTFYKDPNKDREVLISWINNDLDDDTKKFINLNDWPTNALINIDNVLRYNYQDHIYTDENIRTFNKRLKPILTINEN